MLTEWLKSVGPGAYSSNFILVSAFIIIFPLSSVGEMASLSFLLVYAMVILDHLCLANQTGANRWILIEAVLLSLALFILLFTQTIWNHETLTWFSVLNLTGD